MGKQRYRFTPNKRTETNAAYDKLGVRSFLALAPIWQAYQQFCVGDGNPIPSTLKRHATIHTVSNVQYRRRNAVQGLMLACSLVLFINQRGDGS